MSASYFLKSFGVLASPVVLTGMLIYGTLQWLHFYLVTLASAPSESQDAAAPGCLILLFNVLVQTLASGVFVLALMPALLADKPFSPGSLGSFDSPALLVALRAALGVSLFATLLAYVPYVGRLVSGSPGLEIFLSTSLTFHWVLEAVSPAQPGFLFIANRALSLSLLSYLLLTFVATRLAMLVVLHYSPEKEIFTRPPSAFSARQLSHRRQISWTLDACLGLLCFITHARHIGLLLQASK